MSAKPRKPSYLDFNKAAYAWKRDVDYRKHPELYKIGKGEQGVLICEPYKSELAPHWRFKNATIARESAAKIYQLFEIYLKHGDFVGADMARKFLQMGFTRARRYANYEGGTKYDKKNNYKLKLRGTGDSEKAESAKVFYKFWKEAEGESRYSQQKKEWKALFG